MGSFFTTGTFQKFLILSNTFRADCARILPIWHKMRADKIKSKISYKEVVKKVVYKKKISAIY